MNEKDLDQRLYHARWEVALHCFQRGITESAGRAATLAEIQRFHWQWYQNKKNRVQAENIVKCPACEDVLANCLIESRPFYGGIPESARQLFARYGIFEAARCRV